MIAKKYKYNKKDGNWHGKGTVKHLTLDDWNTMCGIHLGSEKQGWFLYDRTDYDCKRCKKVMENYGKE